MWNNKIRVELVGSKKPYYVTMRNNMYGQGYDRFLFRLVITHG